MKINANNFLFLKRIKSPCLVIQTPFHDTDITMYSFIIQYHDIIFIIYNIYFKKFN